MTSSSTLPFSWYTDEEQLRRERATIFARAWQYAGRSEDIAQPGSYLTTDAAGIPVLVTRDDDGELRAFINVCRHRGAVLAEGCETRSSIQCHYHAWTYGLDGALRAAPRADREPGFDRSDWSLLPASVATWGPFLFVNPDPQARPLAEQLGALPEILARDLDVDNLVFHSRVEFGADANWKVVAENFLECYHCATAHPAFSDAGRRASRPLRARGAPDLRRAVLQVEGDGRARPVPPALPEHRHQRVPGPGQPVDRADPAPTGRTEPSATSTTSSPRTWTRTGGGSSSPSTTRSDARTARSSSRCSAAWPPACSTTAGCCSTQSLCWLRSRAGSANSSPRARRAGSRRRARARRRAPRSRGARPALRRSFCSAPVTTGAAASRHGRQLEQPAGDAPGDVLDAAVADRRDRQRLQGALHGVRVGLDRLACALDGDPLVVRLGQLERARRAGRQAPSDRSRSARRCRARRAARSSARSPPRSSPRSGRCAGRARRPRVSVRAKP